MSNLSNPAPVDSILIIEKMLKAHHNAEVDIVDRLPTPLGLVRSGVAPDHPETKRTCNRLSPTSFPGLRTVISFHILGMLLLDLPYIYPSSVTCMMWLSWLMVLKVIELLAFLEKGTLCPRTCMAVQWAS
ncbi:uncharacterized protein LOC141724594 isoform X5 [Apium graveolens]|uniref:uncharacterized protein LOC141724594 isoform X5 n=1 Tax=Apium graveolens TaxID=4045 RepID=UPI003D798DDC